MGGDSALGPGDFFDRPITCETIFNPRSSGAKPGTARASGTFVVERAMLTLWPPFRLAIFLQNIMGN
jgi:hypothetical protein